MKFLIWCTLFFALLTTIVVIVLFGTPPQNKVARFISNAASSRARRRQLPSFPHSVEKDPKVTKEMEESEMAWFRRQFQTHDTVHPFEMVPNGEQFMLQKQEDWKHYLGSQHLNKAILLVLTCESTAKVHRTLTRQKLKLTEDQQDIWNQLFAIPQVQKDVLPFLQSIRQTGCKLPIEIWYRDQFLKDPKVLKELQLEFGPLMAHDILDFVPFRINHPRSMIPLSLFFTSFEEVIICDHFVRFVQNPTHCFSSLQYQETGLLCWPSAVQSMFNSECLVEQIASSVKNTWKNATQTPPRLKQHSSLMIIHCKKMSFQQAHWNVFNALEQGKSKWFPAPRHPRYEEADMYPIYSRVSSGLEGKEKKDNCCVSHCLLKKKKMNGPVGYAFFLLDGEHFQVETPLWVERIQPDHQVKKGKEKEIPPSSSWMDPPERETIFMGRMTQPAGDDVEWMKWI